MAADIRKQLLESQLANVPARLNPDNPASARQILWLDLEQRARNRFLQLPPKQRWRLLGRISTGCQAILSFSCEEGREFLARTV